MHKSKWVRFLSVIASWAVIAAAIMVLVFLIRGVSYARTVVINKPASATAITEQNLPVGTSTDSSKQLISVVDVMPGLIQCESGGHDIIHLDTDGYYSYDVTQFHLMTFFNYGKQFGVIPTSTTVAQARVLIMQTSTVEELTADMLQAGLWKQWYNCGLALGLGNKIIY